MESNLTSVSYFKESWRRLQQNKVAFASFIFLSILIITAILAPFFTSYSYYETQLPLKNLPPSSKFWFGTDELGRDMFTRIWWGARISLFVAFAAAIIDMVIGVFYGAFAGMVGGRIQEMMMRITDILYSLPHLLIVILLMVLFTPGITTIILAMTITGWINMARIVRGQVLQIKESDFVKAAVMFGASKKRILSYHLIPNAIGPIITTVTMTIPAAIITEAFLSFMGLGVQAPKASWGVMASDGLAAMRYYPWRLFFPAICISLTILCFNLLGNGIRDAFDPRLRR